MFKVCFFVPEKYLELVKVAMFHAGAGKIGQYDSCCWQTEGVGQFRPLSGSQPFLGEVGDLTRVKEFKVEMVCEDACIEELVNALKASHPYETPAYEVFKVIDL